jgi:gamma-glutamylcysteine synthetase
MKSDAGVATSKAGTEIEKAVGASDTLTAAELSSAVSLSTIANPAKTLAAAKVDDKHGNIIGPVKAVIQENNKAAAINVDVGGWLGVAERVVSIDASKFKYIASRDILVTSVTKAQVEKMTPVANPHN